jgi:4a-hydroxytetrahydrobiopterin dehydratase
MKLSHDDVRNRLAGLPDWAFEKNALVRQFTFRSFPDAIAFLTRLAFDAEAADHHPDVSLSYRKVRVSWSTHSEGGVTEKDFTGLAQADAVAARFLKP